MILVSSCLLGLCCRYDGQEKADKRVLNYLKDKPFLPICPEQMGGLPTPRKPAEIVSLEPLKIITEDLTDVTLEFEKGVTEVMKLVNIYDIDLAILKSKSPSCGSREVYDGTFSRNLIKGAGILSLSMTKNNIQTINENDLV